MVSPLLINCIVNSLGEGSQTCASWAGGSKQARRQGGRGLRGGWLLTWVYAGFDAQQLVIWHLVVSGTGSQHLSSTRVGRRREGRLAGDLRRQFKRHSGEKSIKCNRSDVASWQAGDLSQHMSRTRVCRRREERQPVAGDLKFQRIIWYTTTQVSDHWDAWEYGILEIQISGNLRYSSGNSNSGKYEYIPYHHIHAICSYSMNEYYSSYIWIHIENVSFHGCALAAAKW